MNVPTFVVLGTWKLRGRYLDLRHCFPLGVFIAFGIVLTLVPTVKFYAKVISGEKTALEMWDAAPMLQSIGISVGTMTIVAIISCLVGIYVTGLKQRVGTHE